MQNSFKDLTLSIYYNTYKVMNKTNFAKAILSSTPLPDSVIDYIIVPYLTPSLITSKQWNNLMFDICGHYTPEFEGNGILLSIWLQYRERLEVKRKHTLEDKEFLNQDFNTWLKNKRSTMH